jgi:hypothetical protein
MKVANRTQDERVRCRLIEAADLWDIAKLLHVGFPRRTEDYWMAGLQNLEQLVPPAGFPKFGHMLQAGARPVGVHLLISSAVNDAPAGSVRCNGSSWYVDPEFRLYGALLLVQGTKLPATYVDIDPNPFTLPIIRTRGFDRCWRGTFVAMPSLGGKAGGTVRILSRRADWIAARIPPTDLRLLEEHESFGCISLWCETRSGGQALIFRRRWLKTGIPCAQMIYCRSIDHLEDVAKPMSQFLLARGLAFMLVPTDKKLRGVPGVWFPDKFEIWCKGPHAPRVGDLAYSETALFGL